MTALQAPPEPTLGAWIRDIRKEAGYSQQSLAEAMAMGVSQADISRWERGKYIPNVFELRRLADITGAEYLYDLRGLPIRWTTPDALAA